MNAYERAGIGKMIDEIPLAESFNLRNIKIVKSYCNDNKPQSQIAKEFGISETTVSKILHTLKGELTMWDQINLNYYRTQPVRTNYSEQVSGNYDDRIYASGHRAAEPIKNIDDIIRVQDYILYERKYKIEDARYRDYLMFTLGINSGLRVSDLTALRVGDIIDDNGEVLKNVGVWEKKTRKKRKKKCVRGIFLNNSIKYAIDIYFGNRNLELDDALFQNYSNNRKSSKENITERSVNDILKTIIRQELKMPLKVSSHMLRKTFGYHVLISSKDRSRALEKLQKLFNHSSPSITLCYIGITNDEIEKTYMDLCLGRTSSVIDNEDREKKIIYFQNEFNTAVGF